ncbi:MAG: prepilin-type N-terminal cleavage/methylation domain-containing protein [Gammaproteobacteria bacterium]
MKRGAARGFTLIELLLALMLLALMTAVLFSALHTANRAWRAGAGSANAAESAALAEAFVRRSVSRLVVRPGALGPVAGPLVGSASAFEFLAPAPTAADLPGLYRIRIAAEAGAGDDPIRLVLRYRLLRPQTTAESLDDAPAHTLLDGLDSATFRFLGNGSSAPVGEWAETWEARGNPPSAIAVDLVLAGGATRAWTVPVYALQPLPPRRGSRR